MTRTTAPDHDPPIARETLSWDARKGGYSALPFVLSEPLEWRRSEDGDRVELFVPSSGKWRDLHRDCRWVLEGLSQGETLSQVHRRTAEGASHRSDRQIRFIVSTTASRLVRWDMAEVLIPEVPELFGGRYQRVAELGRGGMGIVWQCRDTEAPGRQEVAVKHAWNWKGALARRDRELREEAQIMEEANHRGIVAFRGSFEIDGRFHLVRELLAGPPLSSADTDDLSPADRRRLLTGIVDGLIHLRDIGYLCLDVKTSNYMLAGPDGPPKLIDLGLCRRLVDGRVEARGLPGTRTYQDPLLLKEDHADEQTTVYAVGRVLWRLATGASLRARGHYESYFDQHETDLDRLRDSHATGDEVALYEAMCSPRREDRPGSLDELRELIR